MERDLIFEEVVSRIEKIRGEIDWFGIWCCYRPTATYRLMKFGFKIHLSGTVNNAKEILNTVFPILVESDVIFKFCGTYSDLTLLNMGYYGHSQIGKLCTIYPKSEEQLLSLLEMLYRKTKIYNSIEIPSDFRYKNSRVVYYRYGELDTEEGLNNQTKGYLDQREKVIPQNVVVPIDDYNIPRYNKMNGKFYPLKCFRARGKSTVYLAIETEKKDLCVVKRGFYLGELNIYGEDGMEKVNNEYDVLLAFKDKKIFPTVHDIFYFDDSLFLIEEYIEGDVLSDVLTDRKISLRSAFQNILNKIKYIHSVGYIINDLSPDNVIIKSDSNTVRFIDAEQVTLKSDVKKYMINMGTPGFSSEKYLFEDKDLYSFLCMLYYRKYPKEYELRNMAFRDDGKNRNNYFNSSETSKIVDIEKIVGEPEDIFFKRDYESKVSMLEQIVCGIQEEVF